MASKVLTITLNPAIDKSSTVNGIKPEKKLRCSAPKYEPGGGGINVARALARLDVAVDAFFTSGGGKGKLLESLLAQEQVGAIPLGVNAETRENFIVVDTTTEQQYRFGMPGEALTEEEVDEVYYVISKLSPFPEFVVISGSFPPGFPIGYMNRLIRLMKQKGAKIILDTSGDALREALQEGVFMVKPNLGELGKLVGRTSLDNRSSELAAKQLIEAGSTEMVVVSLGAQGAYVVTQDESHYILAPNVKRISTVGAGDSMVGGMVAVLAKGGGTLEMARMGVACGTAATMNAGTALFKKEDVDELYKWLARS
ncbi:1-phosphofructokinase family hexose kinase [Olivibacter sitiensis]|uniref:1-phosphofructokinase family hexose kinase n=1 Tax=Olivibacter sitiensis TaxID=376470 RepID=UPI0004190974|nr:1-phosphofructokinase family hexose kinase [Olivibacter sitiensis]